MVERFDLTPPVDVEGLARGLADIYDEPWPFSECDAVVVGLVSARPSIFLRTGLPLRRRRFTIAHELGHIEMGWHIGVVGCSPSSKQFEVEPLQPAGQAEAIDSLRRLEEQEAEATRFASFLLMPARFLRPLVATNDMPLILRELNGAEVSATAALMRLRAILQPGFCFAVTENDQLRLFSSPGTSLPYVEAGNELAALSARSYEHGRVTVGGRQVHWFRLADFLPFEPVNDPRSTTDLARSAIAASEANPDEQQRLYRSINGVVGGSLSKERADTIVKALAILRHKLKDDPRYGPITSHPDFDLYLRRKAEEWGRKRGL